MTLGASYGVLFVGKCFVVAVRSTCRPSQRKSKLGKVEKTNSFFLLHFYFS